MGRNSKRTAVEPPELGVELKLSCFLVWHLRAFVLSLRVTMKAAPSQPRNLSSNNITIMENTPVIKYERGVVR